MIQPLRNCEIISRLSFSTFIASIRNFVIRCLKRSAARHIRMAAKRIIQINLLDDTAPVIMKGNDNG